MKFFPKSKPGRLLATAAGLGFLLLSGPSLIHLGYRLTTSDAERQLQARRYHELANLEISAKLTGETLEAVTSSRLTLYRWFHARGWPIDEGDEDTSWLIHPWAELFEYWKAR